MMFMYWLSLFCCFRTAVLVLCCHAANYLT